MLPRLGTVARVGGGEEDATGMNVAVIFGGSITVDYLGEIVAKLTNVSPPDMLSLS